MSAPRPAAATTPTATPARRKGRGITVAPSAMSPANSTPSSTTTSSSRSTRSVPTTDIGDVRSADRKPTARTTSPTRRGSVLFTAMLTRNGRTQARSGSVGSSTRSICHQRTMRSVKPAASAARANASGPTRAERSTASTSPRETRRNARPMNSAATTQPSAMRSQRPRDGPDVGVPGSVRTLAGSGSLGMREECGVGAVGEEAIGGRRSQRGIQERAASLLAKEDVSERCSTSACPAFDARDVARRT
jgi:hypothetical protein